MLSRLILRGKAGKEERLRFGKLAFGSRRAASIPDEDYMQVCMQPAWILVWARGFRTDKLCP